jgi:hypothetical protein
MTRSDHQYNVDQTYLALRLGIVLIVALLFGSIASQIWSAECWQTSISAYYYTPTRPVFIASICAIGACLMVYRGNTDTENVLLDFAGFLAFVVAFVPTKVDRTCAAVNVPTRGALESAIANNMRMLLLIGLVSTVVGWYLLKNDPNRPTLSENAKRSVAASVIALIVVAAFFIVSPDRFQRIGHNLSAILFFVGIVGVVIVNAWEYARQRGEARTAKVFRNRYSLTAVLMGLTVAVIVAVRLATENFPHWVFWVEVLLVLEFAMFWIFQTEELTTKVTRDESPTQVQMPAGIDVPPSGGNSGLKSR